LHEQGLVCFERGQLRHDGVEGFPRTCGLAATAVHHQLVRIFGNLGIEVVHQHAQRGFCVPGLA
jgi:hypothetical protein